MDVVWFHGPGEAPCNGKLYVLIKWRGFQLRVGKCINGTLVDKGDWWVAALKH